MRKILYKVVYVQTEKERAIKGYFISEDDFSLKIEDIKYHNVITIGKRNLVSFKPVDTLNEVKN